MAARGLGHQGAGTGGAMTQTAGRAPTLETVAARGIRVLVLVTRDQRRGPETFGVTLASALGALGLSTSVRSLTPAPDGEGVGARPLGRQPFGPGTLRMLRGLMREVDVVVACGSRTLPASVLAGVGTGCPVIYQNIGDPLYWNDGLRRRWELRSLLTRTAAVAAITERSAAVLRTQFKVPDHKLRIIRNARDTARFRPPSTTERRQARELLGAAPDSRLVVLVGALSEEKRVDLAVATIALLPEPTRLMVVGGGPLRSDLERLAARVATGRVEFLGARRDVVQLLWAADAILLTSASEGVPGVLIEAGLCGVPAVTTDVGYVRDVVCEAVTGRVVPTPDPEALARALEEVFADRELMGRHARVHCGQRFDLARAIEDWHDLIETVVEAGGR